ncbi:MAG: hypothetical protein Q8R38_04100 [Candidatus Omnitrophota bacterium]|nr:hypothetical protein [Candidatus Omnitrophota bacterium]
MVRSRIRSWGFGFRFNLLLVISYCLLVTLAGCSATYPKDKIEESVVRICKQEYKVDVKVEIEGKTMAIYLPLADLMDYSFNLSKSASDKINDVIFTAARVALSTDADIDFYCVIAHDVKMPELQVIIIKGVEDIKRLFANDISRGEYMKRMLIDLRWSPQAKKEQVIKEIFSKMNLDAKWQDQVMSDFFRSQPAGIGDIGYWNDQFYIKDITLAEFLAEQMANRIRIAFREDKALKDNFILKAAKAAYVIKKDKRFFIFEVLAEHTAAQAGSTIEDSDKIFETVLSVAGQVIHGYSFNDYDALEILDQRAGRSIEVVPEELEGFRTNKLKLSEIGK